MKRQSVIVQNPHDGTTVKSTWRVIKNISRDEIEDEIGTVVIDGVEYLVSRHPSARTWFGEAA